MNLDYLVNLDSQVNLEKLAKGDLQVYEVNRDYKVHQDRMVVVGSKVLLDVLDLLDQ